MEQHGEYVIKQYSPEHKSDIVELSKILWSVSDNKREKYFVWKHLENPNIEKPCVYVSLYKDKVVGFRCFFGAKYSFHGDTFLISSPCDSMVDPLHRRKGLFTLMTKYGLKDILQRNIFRLHLNLSSNKASTAAYLKLGWMPVAPKKVMFFPTTSIILGKFFPKKGNSVQFFLYYLDNILKKIVTLKPNSKKSFEISKSVLPNEMAKLANKNLNRKKLTSTRDKAFYEWRFENPMSNFIFAYSRNKNLDLTAYAVLSKLEKNNYELVDYQYDNYDNLHSLLYNLIRQLPFRELRTRSFSKDASVLKILNKVGFQYFSILFKFRRFRRLPFLVRPITLSPTEKEWYIGNRDIRDGKNWNLSHIDSDGT